MALFVICVDQGTCMCANCGYSNIIILSLLILQDDMIKLYMKCVALVYTDI